MYLLLKVCMMSVLISRAHHFHVCLSSLANLSENRLPRDQSDWDECLAVWVYMQVRTE